MNLYDDFNFGKQKNVFSDEAHFNPGDYINKQNFCISGIKTHTWSYRRQCFEIEDGTTIAINGDTFVVPM